VGPFKAESLQYGYGQDEGRFVPSFEVKENKDSYLFKADLPGVKEEDLDISLVSHRLTISGKREAEKREEGETWYAYEREYGSFTRSFTLPEGVDPEHVRAELKNGVLHLVIPKKPEVQPRKIQVGGGEKKLKA
jgi:HSP20 family protein